MYINLIYNDAIAFSTWWTTLERIKKRFDNVR